MKLRETLTDKRGGHGKERLTAPAGIGIYPHNALFLALMLVGIIGSGICLPMAIVIEEGGR